MITIKNIHSCYEIYGLSTEIDTIPKEKKFNGSLYHCIDTGEVKCFAYTDNDGTWYTYQGTLGNVLSQYMKSQALTQAEYDAIVDKDNDTLYVIVE